MSPLFMSIDPPRAIACLTFFPDKSYTAIRKSVPSEDFGITIRPPIVLIVVIAEPAVAGEIGDDFTETAGFPCPAPRVSVVPLKNMDLAEPFDVAVSCANEKADRALAVRSTT